MPSSGDNETFVILTIMAIGMFLIGVLNWVFYEYLFSKDLWKLARLFLLMLTAFTGIYGVFSFLDSRRERQSGAILIGSSLIALSILLNRKAETKENTND